MIVFIKESKDVMKGRWGQTEFRPNDPDFGFVIKLDPLLKRHPLRMLITLIHEFSHIALEIVGLHYDIPKIRDIRWQHKFLYKWDDYKEDDMSNHIPASTGRRKRKRKKR